MSKWKQLGAGCMDLPFKNSMVKVSGRKYYFEYVAGLRKFIVVVTVLGELGMLVM